MGIGRHFALFFFFIPILVPFGLFYFSQANQSDVYYYLHKKLDDNYDVISALERQLMVESVDREKAEMEYARQIEELEHRRDEELGPLREKLITVEEKV